MSGLGNKQIMARNIRYYLQINGLTQTDICKALGIKAPTFSDWVNAKTYPRIDKIEMMSNYFGISKSDLVEDHSIVQRDIPTGFEPLPKMKRVPLIGEIACGQPITAEENLEGYVAVPDEWRADFTLTCRGDSMEPRIQNGDIVAIRKQPDVEDGEIAAVRIDCDATLKHVYHYPDRLVLQPENTAFPPIVLVGEEINTVCIEGKAIGLCRGI